MGRCPTCRQPMPEKITRAEGMAFIECWNLHRGTAPAVVSLSEKRKQIVRDCLRLEPDLERWAGAFQAFSATTFIREGRYGFDTCCSLKSRSKWLDAGQTEQEQKRPDGTTVLCTGCGAAPRSDFSELCPRCQLGQEWQASG